MMAYLLSRIPRQVSKKAIQMTTAFAFYSSNAKLMIGKLPGRGFIQIQGEQASNFLQGLITNDMRHFDEHESAEENQSNVGKSTQKLTSVSGMKNSMYAMMLNINGQILYDLLLYNVKTGEPHSKNFLVECDQSCLGDLLSLLKKYRLRKQIDVEDVSDQYSVWIVSDFEDLGKGLEDGFSSVSEPELLDPSKVICMTKDPRTQALGYRIILQNDVDPNAVFKNSNIVSHIQKAYTNKRHKLGVWEGVEDIPPNECYPLECNADYMHGLSFHKGCYIGQELTARTHHTGVIRKRVMPIVFDFEDESPIKKWTTIENELGRSVGRFINKIGKFGIAQIRMVECFASSSIQIKGHNGKLVTYKPKWWPLDVTKESMIKE